MMVVIATTGIMIAPAMGMVMPAASDTAARSNQCGG
jgi:hypothetical protein